MTDGSDKNDLRSLYHGCCPLNPAIDAMAFPESERNGELKVGGVSRRFAGWRESA
jgi:hypothetical protein